jgi:hypothetical protein
MLQRKINRGRTLVAVWFQPRLRPALRRRPWLEWLEDRTTPTATLDWVHQFGTPLPTNEVGRAVDGHGNVYVVGDTNGTFDGQAPAGGQDTFLAKYDSGGNQLWVRQLGTAGNDVGNGVAVDAAGNAYLSGYTSGTFSGQTSAGGTDAFLAKYDGSGNQLWVRQLGTAFYDYGGAVAVDGAGNAFLTGFTTGTFGGLISAGGRDAFLAKYDATGNQLWLRQLGTSGADSGFGLASDSSGNAYVVGETDGAFTGQSSAGGQDVFLAKYDGDGNQLWVRQLGIASTESATGAAVDPAGNAYLAGYTYGTFSGQASAGGQDAFLAKYDAAGNPLWVRQLGTPGNDSGSGVAVDDGGSAYLAGTTGGALSGQSSAGDSDVFLAKYDGGGSPLWVRQLGTPGIDTGYGVAVDGGSAYLTGTVIWGTFSGETSAGGQDVFLAKYTVNHGPTDISLSNSSVAEGLPAGTTAGTLSSTDADLPDDTHTYSLASGSGDADNASFTITGNQLQTNAVFDYEAKNSYSIRVRTTDAGGLWYEGTFTIAVTYVPSATVAFREASGSALESSGDVPLELRLSLAQPVTVTVPISVVSGTATPGTDFELPTTVTFAANTDTATLWVHLYNDASYESARTVVIALGSPTNAVLGSPATFTLTIQDDDPPPRVGFRSLSTSVEEGIGSFQVIAYLSSPSAVPVRVPITISGTATAADYSGIPAELIFAPGATTALLPVTITDDTVAERAETIVLTMGTPTNALPGELPSFYRSHTITIAASDAPTVNLSFTPASQSNLPVITRTVDKSIAWSVPVYVNLSGLAVDPITVDLSFAGSATPGVDYTPTATSVTIPAGYWWGYVNLDVPAGTIADLTRTVYVSIANLPDNALRGASPVALNINDRAILNFQRQNLEASESDGTVRPIAELNKPLPTETRIPVTFSAGTLSRADLTGPLSLGNPVEIVIPAGQTSGYYDVPLARDGVIEPTPELGTFRMGQVSGNIIVGPRTSATLKLYDEPYVTFATSRTGGYEGSTISLAATLSSPTNHDVHVQLGSDPLGRWSGGWRLSYVPGAVAGTDYTMPAEIVIPTGGITAVLSITAVHHPAATSDKDFIVRMQDLSGARGGQVQSAQVTILDIDKPLPTVDFDSVSNDVMEGGTSSAIVRLSAARAEPVTVTIARSAGTASLADFWLDSYTVQIPAWATSAGTTLRARG